MRSKNVITIERSELGTHAGIAHGPTGDERDSTSPLTRTILRGRVALDRLISCAEARPARRPASTTTPRRTASDRLSPMPT
jgi:hypothetical protein